MMVEPRAFTTKDGRKMVLRMVKWEDLDDLMEFINSLIEEGADVLLSGKITRNEEADWLGKRLAQVERGEFIDVVAEVEGKVVANSEVERRSGLMNHVGYVGVGVKAEYRRMGIGTQLMKMLIDESKKAGLRILVLDYFETNKAARKLYEKMGFKQVGKTPKGICKNGKYTDLIRMSREI